MVGAYFINLVLLLDMQLLIVTQGTVQILVADLSTGSFFKTKLRHCLCFPKRESVPKAVICLENKKTHLCQWVVAFLAHVYYVSVPD